MSDDATPVNNVSTKRVNPRLVNLANTVKAFDSFTKSTVAVL